MSKRPEIEGGKFIFQVVALTLIATFLTRPILFPFIPELKELEGGFIHLGIMFVIVFIGFLIHKVYGGDDYVD